MEIVLEAGRLERNYWRDLWRYRELFQMLAWRDVAIRYKQTVIGVVWALIRPFLTMVVFVVVFGRIAGLPSEGAAPYALMVFAGLLPWMLFSTVLTDASNSLLSNGHLLSKVYFPRLLMPAASVGVAIIDFLINFFMLALLMIWYRFPPSWHIVLLPGFVAVAVVASLGPGLWITALNVSYRDFRHVVPFLVQFGMYLTPVGFSSGVVPDEWRLLYSLNPMVGVIDGFRWCILGGESQVYWPGFTVSLMAVALLLISGVRRFRRLERTFADLI